MNIELEYLYRDAGNNKIWSSVVFGNSNKSDIAELERKIRATLIDGDWFVAEKLGVPPLKFKTSDESLDHGWHEFHQVSLTCKEVTDDSKRDIKDFIEAMVG